MKKNIAHNEAGLTLIELMITAGVVVVGLVAAMQSILSLARHSDVIEARQTMMEFTHSILEDMRSRELDDLLSFEPNLPVMMIQDEGGSVSTNPTLIVPGFGPVEEGAVEIYIDAFIPGGEFPIYPNPGDPDAVAEFPNPLPIMIQMEINGPFGDRPVTFRTSTLVAYQ